MLLTKRALLMSAVLIAAGSPVIAQGHHAAGSTTGTAKSAPMHDPEMHQAMEKMHQDMMKANTGDPDKDFAIMMIPHHQGAIDMAKGYLKKGKDAKFRKLAEDIIEAQEKEIKEMKEHLATLEAKGGEGSESKK